MDLDDFRVFLAIYKHGSISKAAASLYMNQSNLSSKIQKLEKEIGAELFVRGRGRHSNASDGSFPFNEGKAC